MKRLLAIILGLTATVLPAMAANFNCTTTSACSASATMPCDWATAGSWSSCNSTYPNNTGGNTYTATISAGAAVNLATDALAVGLATQANPAITVNGSLTFSESTTTGRDANGYRTITLIPNNAGATNGVAITVATTGVVKGTSGNRIFFDTSSGNRAKVVVNGGGIWDFQGSVAQTTLTAVASITSNTTYCDTAGVNQYYVVTLKDQVSQAKVGRRIVFQSGQMRNRHYEIVSVSGKTVGFCTDRLDSMSANDECTAASTPYACCSGAKAGTCTLGQRIAAHAAFGNFTTPHHWTPADTPNNAICTASVTPRPYCTGNGAGTGSNIIPQVGDKVALVDDVWAMQSAGTVGFEIATNQATSSIRTSALNAGGGIGIGGTSAGVGTEIAYDAQYINLHDMPSTTYGISFTAFANGPNLRWNTVHDEAATVGGNGGALLFSGLNPTTCPCITGAEITDNFIYRTLGNGINVNGANYAVPAKNIKVQRNIVAEGCTNLGAECNAIEVDECTNCDVSNNIVMDWGISTGPSLLYGACYRYAADSTAAASDSAGTVFHHNIAVNCGKTGFQFDGTNNSSELVTATANYTSNTYLQGMGFSGRFYGNIVRNWDMGKQNTAGIHFPALAKGNFLLHFDDAVYTSLCGGASCYGKGIQDGLDATYLTDNPPLVFSDNIITRTGDNFPNGISFTGDARGVITVAHTTVDLNGIGATSPVGIDFLPAEGAWAPKYAVEANVTDSAITHVKDTFAFRCSTSAGTLENIYLFAGNRSSIAAERVNVATPVSNRSSCTQPGTWFDPTFSGTGGAGLGFLNRKQMDYNLAVGSPLLTGGSNGTALGARAFRFDRDFINQLWGNGFPFEYSAGDATGATIPPFPKNVSNGQANTDTDGDGVMDFLDNCPTKYNPAQQPGDC